MFSELDAKSITGFLFSLEIEAITLKKKQKVAAVAES